MVAKALLTLVAKALLVATLNTLVQAQLQANAQTTFCLQAGGGDATGQQSPNGGSICSSTQQGLLPDVKQMVSTMITSPASDENLDAQAGFTVRFTTSNLMSGFALNPETQFMLAPQTLAANGLIEGQQQLSIQALGFGKKAPSAKTTAFFQAVNTKSDADGNTNFSIDVPAGTITTTGLHRICTMAASSSGQPVVMPVAQRGAQDDCIRVTISGAGAAAGKKRKAVVAQTAGKKAVGGSEGKTGKKAKNAGKRAKKVKKPRGVSSSTS